VNELSDQELLRDYAERQSDVAFAELVRRHVDFVYSAALRMVCDSHTAEDVTQNTFIALAKNAREVRNRSVLSGWLHSTARNLAANTIRTEVRRRNREQEAAAMNELLANESDVSWKNVAPYLDDAIAELADSDRDALLLRYFERKSAREMGQIFGTSEDAAKKRVSRAVERLREFFSKRGVTIGAGGLVVLISTNAVQSAPAALAGSISTAAITTTAIHISTAVTATKVIAMTTLQKAVIGATIAVAIGTGIFEAHKNSGLRGEYQALEQQKNSLTAQVGQMQHERDVARTELASVSEENARLKSGQNLAELLKLRGEVGVLRDQSAAADSNSVPANALAKVMDSSTEKELSRVKLHEALKQKYTPLFQQLNLSPDDTEKFYNLIIDNEMKKKTLLAQLLKGDVDVSSALQLRDTGKAELETQIAGLLGSAGYSQYETYNHTADASLAVKLLNDQLGSLALNPDQTQSLQAMLANKDLNINAYLDDMDLFRPKEELDEIYQKVVDHAHQDLQEASSILTPEQLAAAATIQSNTLETVRNTITLSRQLVNTTAKQKAR